MSDKLCQNPPSIREKNAIFHPSMRDFFNFRNYVNKAVAHGVGFRFC